MFYILLLTYLNTDIVYWTGSLIDLLVLTFRELLTSSWGC